MGEARAKSRRRSEILAGARRCIYCESPPTTIEHMPPIAMFRRRSRPSGLEFASCIHCNTGTRAADLVAIFLARLSAFAESDQGKFVEAVQMRGELERRAPGVLNELIGGKKKVVWLRGPSGIARKTIKVRVQGSRTTAHLRVFSAKLGMALYREHIGESLPLNGAVYGQSFLNAGLAEKSALKILKVPPFSGSLKQGKFEVADQFVYHFNCDNRSIVAALASFHFNLHFLVVATSTPERYEFQQYSDGGKLICPGDLVSKLPSA